MTSSKPLPFDFDISKFKLPASGTSPFTGTREESIASSTSRVSEIQKMFPNVDVKGSIIEPSVNMHYDLKEKVDLETRTEHEALMKQMMDYLMPSPHTIEFASFTPTSTTQAEITKDPASSSDRNEGEDISQDSEVDAKLKLAEETFWRARDVLKEHQDILESFDSIYIRPDRPVRVMLEQMRECFSYMPQVKAAMAAASRDAGVKDRAVKGQVNE